MKINETHLTSIGHPKDPRIVFFLLRFPSGATAGKNHEVTWQPRVYVSIIGLKGQRISRWHPVATVANMGKPNQRNPLVAGRAW